MSVFPAIIPSTRIYSPGDYPSTTHRTYAGSQVRVRHSNAVQGARLRLFFPALTTSELLQIKAHYAGRRGGFESFNIPDELLSGMATPADFTPVGQRWLYVGRPQVEDISVDGDAPSNFHDVTVELVSVAEKAVVFVPRLIFRLTPQAPTIVGTAPAIIEVPAVTFTLTPLSPTVAATASFSPADLSPDAWWDASDTGTVTTSSGDVTDWNDKSGNGWHLSQGTSGRRPAYVSSAINGLHAIQWPSTDNPRSLDSASGSLTVKEVYVVLECSSSSFSNYEGIFASRNNSLSETIGGAASGNGLQVDDLPAYLNGNNATDVSNDLFPEIETPCLLRFVVPGSGWATTAGVTIGMDRALNSFDRGWNGYIAEVVVFSTALSSGDRGDLETHLMGKWGI